MPARRLCALGVVLALLVALPPGLPRGCPECPPGCPMHARRPPDGAQARRPGCHRAQPLPAGTVCLRSACGRHLSTEAPAALTLLPSGRLQLAPWYATTRLGLDEPRPASLPSPDPPTDPPRASLA